VAKGRIKEIKVNQDFHVIKVRKAASEFSEDLGFSEIEQEQISIAASELAQNLIANEVINGRIIISELIDGNRKGIEIISLDEGPGISDVSAVMEDGFSSTNGLGIGLGAVKRMMSEVKITSKPRGGDKGPKVYSRRNIGTKIIARKYLKEKKEHLKIRTNRLRFGIFTRSKLGERYNGDTYFLKRYHNTVVFSVIDGLGHGKGASEPAKKAYLYLDDHYQEELESIINGLHQNLKRTRGAAISIAKVDENSQKLQYIGIGNVLTRIYNKNSVISENQPIRPVNYNGTLGIALRSFKLCEYDWSSDYVITMASDGISSRFNPRTIPGLLKQHPIIIAKTLLDEFGKDHDDATILVGA
jgi:anti-sigma regulatory factor (Ser/Thr protein kinase)